MSVFPRDCPTIAHDSDWASLSFPMTFSAEIRKPTPASGLLAVVPGCSGPSCHHTEEDHLPEGKQAQSKAEPKDGEDEKLSVPDASPSLPPSAFIRPEWTGFVLKCRNGKTHRLGNECYEGGRFIHVDPQNQEA